MLGAIGALPFAVLNVPGVQLEDGLLERGVKTRGGQAAAAGGYGHAREVGAHLRMLASLHEGTDRVEGTSAAGVEVGPVVGVQDLYKVHALGLGDRGHGVVALGWPRSTPRYPLAPTGTHSDVLAGPVALLPPLHRCWPVDLQGERGTLTAPCTRGCPTVSPHPRYLPVPLADVIQGQGEEMVLGADKEAATLLIQQQGLVTARPLQCKEAQPMASPQLCQDPPALLSPAIALAAAQHTPLPQTHIQGHLGLAMGPPAPLCHLLPQTCSTGLTRFTTPCWPSTHPHTTQHPSHAPPEPIPCPQHQSHAPPRTHSVPSVLIPAQPTPVAVGGAEGAIPCPTELIPLQQEQTTLCPVGGESSLGLTTGQSPLHRARTHRVASGEMALACWLARWPPPGMAQRGLRVPPWCTVRGWIPELAHARGRVKAQVPAQPRGQAGGPGGAGSR